MTQLNFEIDLQEGLTDKEKAKVVIKKVQDAIDELVISNQEWEKNAKEALKTAKEYEAQVDKLLEANIDLSDALKNVHIFLNSKRDLFKKDKASVEFMEKLATWTISSSAIKAGVMSAKRENNERS